MAKRKAPQWLAGRAPMLVLLLLAVACSDSATQASSEAPGGGAAESPPSTGGPSIERRSLAVAVDTWLAHPASETALALVAEIAADGGVDDAPYLIDLVRITGSSEVRDAALAALAAMRGAGPPPIDVNLAYVELGSWALDQRPRPGTHYLPFKSALYASIDDRFGPLVAQMADPAMVVGLQWGGVHYGAIRELNEPVRRPRSEISWADPTEIVFQVEVAGRSVVYPRRIIGRHELANDEAIDGAGQRVPFGVSYCSLCRTAVAFDRRVDGRVLTFKTSGLLLGANKVMADDETGSLWQQATGLAIAGPLTGSQLSLLPVRAVAFGEVGSATAVDVVDLPAPFIVDPETGTFTSYAYTNTEPLPDYLAGGRLWFPVADVGSVNDPLVEVATLEFGGAALAVGVSALEPVQSVEIDVGTARVRVEQGAVGPRFYDSSGVAPEGQLPAGREAWFSWYARHPETLRWP
jgi:Protein of unknown function (DUF3179)